MLLAGYREQSDATYFLMHNSWGDKFGDHGYAWFHETTLGKLKAARIVDAVPASASIVGANAPMKPVAVCPKGDVPDGATEACAPACPDGAPRFDDHCAESDCDEGEINVHGVCVAAAPTHKGSVAATNVQRRVRLPRLGLRLHAPEGAGVVRARVVRVLVPCARGPAGARQGRRLLQRGRDCETKTSNHQKPQHVKL